MLALRFVIAFVLSSVAISAKIFHADHETRPLFADIAKRVNTERSSWTAGVPFKFENATIADLKRVCGTVLPGEEGYEAPANERTQFLLMGDVPETFDVRTAWPQCSAVTGLVRDQSSCGSCWAFGSTEAFNDRHCISTGDAKTIFSPQDTAACCSGPVCSFSAGCNGGQPSGAWNWFTKTGVVSGGDYSSVGTGQTCEPYTLQSCAHHVDPPAGMVACDEVPEYSTPKCVSSCEKGYATPYASDKKKAKTSYSVKGVANMQKELMERGTLSVSLTVYEDFPTYTSGVYKHVTGKSLGGHAIKMIGWGVENGTPYWLCVNSWNNSWGDKGLFKILRGSDECGIESGVVAGEV